MGCAEASIFIGQVIGDLFTGTHHYIVYNSGIAVLPLHEGKAPEYLIKRMKRMASAITNLIINEYGTATFLQRISDPLWFQAFGTSMGYDWHSSGVTTVLTGVLRDVLSMDEYGVTVIGGKGKFMTLVPKELEVMSEAGIIHDHEAKALQRASKITAKIDTAAVQSGYQLYHHAIFLDERDNWVIVQQGMNEVDRTARRYHWAQTQNFVDSPPEYIIGIKRQGILNMVDKEAERARKASLDAARERPSKIMAVCESAKRTTLDSFSDNKLPTIKGSIEYTFPSKVDWKTVKALYENPPSTYDELLLKKGVGPSIIRALALFASLIYGEKLSWRDPIKYSFAVGGKDGVPYPVDKATYDQAIKELEDLAKQARLDANDKNWMLRKLASN
ncbi:MAG: DUF763 domain-containing protein [Thermoprotei archaeon]